jgi:hypothetical protein
MAVRSAWYTAVTFAYEGGKLRNVSYVLVCAVFAVLLPHPATAGARGHGRHHRSAARTGSQGSQ